MSKVQILIIDLLARLPGQSLPGEIKTGNYADIIAIKDDPTKDIKLLGEVGWVMKDGVVYKTGK